MNSFKDWLQIESMSVYVQGYDYQDDINDLDDVANSLKRKVLYPAWEKLSKEQQEMVEKGGSGQHSMIVPDGDYYADSKNQVINFYTAGWPHDMVPGLIQGIKYYLDEMRIKYGQFKIDDSGMFDSEVVRIPVLQYSTSKNSPALLNLSNDNAMVIFRDLLKFPEESGGFVDISPADLYRKIETLEKDMIDIHARDPYSSQQKGGATYISGGLSSEGIASRLEQLKQIAKWALDNHYDQMYVV